MLNKLFIVFFSLCLQCKSNASTLLVGKAFPYTSIQQAINAAKNGDTILVHEGIYKEHTITITKRVTLKGIGYPVLDGQKKYEIVAVKVNGAVVDGFRIQ